MKQITTLALLAALSGCSMFDTLTQERAAEVADKALAVATYGTCDAATLGALRRRYPNQQDFDAAVERCRQEAQKK